MSQNTYLVEIPINNYKDRQTYYGALNLLEPDLILEKYTKGLAKSEWQITCELFAPYAPEENPLEAIWFLYLHKDDCIVTVDECVHQNVE